VGATLSSGGFSKDFYRPSWQDAAVAAYFASPTYAAHTPHEEFYADGRAYPDVAAFGQNVQVVSAGKASGVSGTSCSAPIFAGKCLAMLLVLPLCRLFYARHRLLSLLQVWSRS
jgi:tripeptidyl-peptidase-1